MLEIPLTKGFVTLISDEDVDLQEFNWHVEGYNKSYYAIRTIQLAPGTREYTPRKSISMHNVIAQRIGFNGKIDHKDMNSLNNQRGNLREATHQENMRNKGLRSDNKTGYKGVTYANQQKKYKASICLIKGEKLHLGYYNTPEEAAREYDRVALSYFKEFAVLNFPS